VGLCDEVLDPPLSRLVGRRYTVFTVTVRDYTSYRYRILMGKGASIELSEYMCGDYAFSVPTVVPGIRYAVLLVGDIEMRMVDVIVDRDRVQANLIVDTSVGGDIRVLLPAVDMYDVVSSRILVRGAILFTSLVARAVSEAGVDLYLSQIDAMVTANGGGVNVDMYSYNRRVYEHYGFNVNSTKSISGEYMGVKYIITGSYPLFSVYLEQDMFKIAVNPLPAVAAFYHALTGKPYKGPTLVLKQRVLVPVLPRQSKHITRDTLPHYTYGKPTTRFQVKSMDSLVYVGRVWDNDGRGYTDFFMIKSFEGELKVKVIWRKDGVEQSRVIDVLRVLRM